MIQLTCLKSRSFVRLCLAGVLIGLSVFVGCRDATTTTGKGLVPRRIVSTVPSVTEVLFELGLGDRVVGVSEFCNYPEAAKKLPKVGGLSDPNLERIVALEPDLVLMLEGSGDQVENFKTLDLPVLLVDHRSIRGVIESFRTIGARCGVPAEGEQLAKELTDRIDRLRKRAARDAMPRTLICVERALGAGRLEDLHVAGKSPFFNESLSVAGGKNVMADSLIDFPTISIEGVLQTDPEVIFDMAPVALDTEEERRAAMADWASVDVHAVRDGRVYLLTEDYALIPGPRFILLLEKFADLLHEEGGSGPDKKN